MQSDTTVRSWKRGKGKEKIGKTQLKKRLKSTDNWTNKTDKLAEGKKTESFYGIKLHPTVVYKEVPKST